jgi:hypothetical protein
MRLLQVGGIEVPVEFILSKKTETITKKSTTELSLQQYVAPSKFPSRFRVGWCMLQLLLQLPILLGSTLFKQSLCLTSMLAAQHSNLASIYVATLHALIVWRVVLCT